MKKLLITLTLLVGFTANAKSNIIMNVDAIYEHVCVYEFHAFNVPQCVKDMEKCVSNVLTRRILINHDKSVVYYDAIRNCSLREPIYSKSIKKETRTIQLFFDSVYDKRQWLVWYLDKGGEEQSEFLVENWEFDTMHLINDSQPNLVRE